MRQSEARRRGRRDGMLGSGHPALDRRSRQVALTRLVALLLLSLGLVAACSTAPGTAQPTPTAVRVVRVVDGDTIEVQLGAQTATVRLIGIDTPETKDPNAPVMCYGKEATARTQALIQQAGGRVRLEKDVSETDRYGRLLRYVWLEGPDGERMLNEELVAQGYAQVSTYPPDVKYQERFLRAQRAARAQGLGLWGACGEFGAPALTPTAASKPAATQPPATSRCDPSYPTVCIPPPPPDLDCSDVPYRNFAVRPPDPHRFDLNHDGIGCAGE